MDAKLAELKERFERILKEAANVATELDVAAGTLVGVPHYSVIELRAHEIGRQVSRMVQERQMGEVVAAGAARVRCPTCQTVCESTARKREVTSIDGPVELLELKCHCDECRRDFFPSAGGARV
jgi:hypothetical protein